MTSHVPAIPPRPMPLERPTPSEHVFQCVAEVLAGQINDYDLASKMSSAEYRDEVYKLTGQIWSLSVAGKLRMRVEELSAIHVPFKPVEEGLGIQPELLEQRSGWLNRLLKFAGFCAAFGIAITGIVCLVSEGM